MFFSTLKIAQSICYQIILLGYSNKQPIIRQVCCSLIQRIAEFQKMKKLESFQFLFNKRLPFSKHELEVINNNIVKKTLKRLEKEKTNMKLKAQVKQTILTVVIVQTLRYLESLNSTSFSYPYDNLRDIHICKQHSTRMTLLSTI